MASAFAQGMESGTRMAKSWLDTYNTIEEQTRKRRAAEEISAAGSTGLADIPEQPRVYTPDMQVQPAPTGLGTGAYGTQDDFTSIQPQQGLVAPSAAPATPPGTGYARGFTPEQAGAVRTAYAAGGAPAVARTAAEQGMPAQGLTRELPMSQQLKRQADVYAKYGLTDQAEQYRLKAYDVSRQEMADAQTRKLNERADDEYTRKQKTNEAAQWMAQQISTGRTADMTLIAEAQTKFQGNYDTLLSTTANVLGITEKIAKQKTDQLVNQINEAVLGGDVAFNKLLGSFADPNKEDDITPKLMSVKGGVQVMYGNKPMSPVFTGADGISPLQQAGAFYINTAQGKPFETAIQMQNLAKGAAQIKASEASTAKDKALGGLYAQGGAGAGKGGLKQKVSDFKEVYGREPTEAEKGVLAGLSAKEPNKGDVDRDAWLKAEQKLIENDATPEAIQAQRTAFFVRRGYAPAAARQVLEAGVNPATGKPLTRSDVDAYNKTYPQTPVDPGSLPWLPSPEREALRQGLISQIPR